MKAHIIPEALTRPAERGKPYMQAGEGTRPTRRWTSWYDSALVTAEGEQILADYDRWGIAELRRLKLVWSSWDGDQLDVADHNRLPGGTHGLRIIEGTDGPRLRLFLLSILWRAAATTLPEFGAINITSAQLRRLGEMLRTQDPGPLVLFPTSLAQVSTRGPWHNHSPIFGRKRLEREGRKPRDIRIFRFFFDGLAVHFHRDVDPGASRGMGGMAVGAQARLGVITVTFDASFQRENLELALAETAFQWPAKMKSFLSR